MISRSLLFFIPLSSWNYFLSQQLSAYTRQQMANVAAFLSLTKESRTIPVPQLITTDCGVHLSVTLKPNGESVVSI